MKPNSLLLLAALLAAAPAFAAGTLPEKANAKAAAHAALADGTDDVSNKPTTFPSQAQASDQARKVAFGVKGADERAAHSKAGQHAADQAGDESASRSGAAASAAKSANANSQSAAGLARAAGARNTLPPGTPPPRGE